MNAINHSGVVERTDEHSVYVKVVPQTSCTGCQARSMCISSGGNEQIIEVPDDSGEFHVNDPVILSGESSMGIQAVWLAFIIPLILVVATIIITTHLQWKESTSALTGLSLLVPYYAVSYLLRDKLKKKFVFTIKKINQ